MSANLSRRSFIAGSAAMGGMMLGVSSSAEAKVPSKWDFKADVIVVGAGAAGIPAAIRAVEQGLSVLVVDANYDIGGHAIISQGNTLLGGGNAMQQKYGIKDSPETVFKDLTDWSVTLPNGFADYRFNDRDMQAMIAKESVPTYDWLVKIGSSTRSLTMPVLTAQAAAHRVNSTSRGRRAPISKRLPARAAPC